MSPWVQVRRGHAPLIVTIPHAGIDIPADIEARLASPWLARKDADWWLDRLYDFVGDLDATVISATASRTVIDVNRDPSGASLYPGQATTGLCPLTTFDGELLYLQGQAPDALEIERRRQDVFEPFHQALSIEIARLKAAHDRVVLYDAHSIRSRIPRLFEGVLPHFNIGVNEGRSCNRALVEAVALACAGHPDFSQVVDGRFKGGWITRHYGKPAEGVHAIQMELACRGYMAEPDLATDEASWPTPYDPGRAAAMRRALRDVLQACLAFTAQPHDTQ